MTKLANLKQRLLENPKVREEYAILGVLRQPNLVT
jgi:hypothetical protein